MSISKLDDNNNDDKKLSICEVEKVYCEPCINLLFTLDDNVQDVIDVCTICLNEKLYKEINFEKI